MKVALSLGVVRTGLVAVALCTGFQMPASGAYNLSGSFAFASVGVYDGVGNTIIPDVINASAAGPVDSEAGTAPSAYGKFRAAPGSNGFQTTGVGGIDREVDGGSVWSDGFTITGGSGSGSLSLSTHIDGSISGTGQMEYALFVSSQPYDLDSALSSVSANHNGFWALAFPNSTRLVFTGVANGCGTGIFNKECGHTPYQNYSGPLDVAFSASVPFTYGQPVYVLSLFVGAVLTPGGNAGFYNSASFGISAPPGATIASLSGVLYAAAVPEPPVSVLFVLGFGAMFLRRSVLSWSDASAVATDSGSTSTELPRARLPAVAAIGKLCELDLHRSRH